MLNEKATSKGGTKSCLTFSVGTLYEPVEVKWRVRRSKTAAVFMLRKRTTDETFALSGCSGMSTVTF